MNMPNVHNWPIQIIDFFLKYMSSELNNKIKNKKFFPFL